jgi:chromosome segregation ATPase
MPIAKFQLRSVSIEGFKGFTHPQTVTFSGKHAFLFGKNYSGKSSIVEAIRWCLFGLRERPERVGILPLAKKSKFQPRPS